MISMSARIEVDVQYARELVEALHATLPSLIGDHVADAVQIVGERMLNDARQFVPVRTGFLLSTITLEPEPGTWTFNLLARAPYAAYVEWGTSRMQAKLFMTRAVELHKDEMTQEIQNAVSRAVAESLG